MEQKRELILSTYAKDYADWHASKMTFFMVGLNSKIQAASKRNLLLDFSNVISSNPGRVDLFPKLRAVESTENHFHAHGFDLKQLAESGLVPLMPTLAQSSQLLAERRSEYALQNGLSEFGKSNKGMMVAGCSVFKGLISMMLNVDH